MNTPSPVTSTSTPNPARAAKPTVPFRIGHGFDLHRLEPGRPLILGGLKLEHDRGCAGHSDGDAIYHCVVDAVLGALALPDIGQLFPDTDPKFKDCESHVFMSAAYERMRKEGYSVGNLDVTVILEKPKMSPHKMKMRQNIADLLHIPIEDVNLKAKTHEKVDAVGENRAVSVHAVAVLIKDEDESTMQPPSSSTSTGQQVTNSLLKGISNRIGAINNITTGSMSNDFTDVSTSDSGCAVKRLHSTIISKQGADPSSSWTAKLFSKGRKKIAEKVGEEAVEVVIDAVDNNKENVIKESADLLYHLNVLWADMGITPDDVFDELASRQGTSGLQEKASRKK